MKNPADRCRIIFKACGYLWLTGLDSEVKRNEQTCCYLCAGQIGAYGNEGKITAGALFCDLWDSVAMKALDDVAEVLCEIPDENKPRVFRMFANASKPEANTSSTLVGGMVKAMKATSIVDE